MSCPYKWQIIKDLLTMESDKLPELVSGPRNCLDNVEMPDKFRMLDDDGVVYYEGICNCLSNNHPDVNGFEPLDDFGEPNAGCTSIEYWNEATEGWEML